MHALANPFRRQLTNSLEIRLASRYYFQNTVQGLIKAMQALDRLKPTVTCIPSCKAFQESKDVTGQPPESKSLQPFFKRNVLVLRTLETCRRSGVSLTRDFRAASSQIDEPVTVAGAGPGNVREKVVEYDAELLGGSMQAARIYVEGDIAVGSCSVRVNDDGKCLPICLHFVFLDFIFLESVF
jgi:hypothetical protein